MLINSVKIAKGLLHGCIMHSVYVRLHLVPRDQLTETDMQVATDLMFGIFKATSVLNEYLMSEGQARHGIEGRHDSHQHGDPPGRVGGRSQGPDEAGGETAGG